nr:reverse transcriptase domain-containing protein [Tanacetum cinerariifolium]
MKKKPNLRKPYRDCDSNRDNWRSNGRNDYNRDNYPSNSHNKSDLQKQLCNFIKAQHSTNSFVKDTFMDLKTKLNTTTKNHQASIQNIKAKFDKFAEKQSGRPYQPPQANPKGSSSKPYQPPQARNEHVNSVFTQSGKTYDLPINPNDQPNDSETLINFDSDDEDNEPTPQPKHKEPKPVRETPIPKPYKPKILYPQLLKKEKMETQYGKFLDMIRAIRINEDIFFTLPMHINVIEKILEEDFDALLDEGSEILHSIEGTILEEKLFAEFDEFMEMTIDENSESKSDTKEPPFEKSPLTHII